MIKIIIADDHPGMREAWRFMLELQDEMEVIALCSNGKELLDCCMKSLPDLILMDINMEPMGGFEATELLISMYPSLHIIGISVNAEPSYAQKMLGIGAKGFITKSSPTEEIISGIREAIDGGSYICREIRSKMNSDN